MISADGRTANRYRLAYATIHLPSRVAEEHSEDRLHDARGVRFVEDWAKPWIFLHLSPVQAHWPYMAPAPYLPRCTAPRLPGPSIAMRRELVDPILCSPIASATDFSFQHPEAPGIVRPAWA